MMTDTELVVMFPDLEARLFPAPPPAALPAYIFTVLDRDMVAEYDEERALEFLAHQQREAEWGAEDRDR